MLPRASMRAAARMTAVAAATLFCASATMARAPAQIEGLPDTWAVPAIAASVVPVKLAALEPIAAPPRITAPPSMGPFGLAATHTGSMADRWRILQPLLTREHDALARCYADRSACTPAVEKFAAIVAAGAERTGIARLGEINRAVNLAIRPVSDQVQYGVPDIWATPLMTFGSGAGDCEDYAIAKFVALREAGMAADDVRLIVVRNLPAHEDHMVAAARLDGRWLILDNRTMRLVADVDIIDLSPLAVLEGSDPAPPVVAAVPRDGVGFPVDL